MIHEVKTPRTFWENYKSSVKRNFQRQPLDTYELSFTESVLSLVLDSYEALRGRHEHWFVRWEDVVAVEAYKTDNLTYDTIWVRVTDNEGSTIVWSDEAKGWTEIAAAFPLHLPGCTTLGEWFTDVAFPEPKGVRVN